MKVNPDNPSELSFKEVLKDKNASRFFPVLTPKVVLRGEKPSPLSNKLMF